MIFLYPKFTNFLLLSGVNSFIVTWKYCGGGDRSGSMKSVTSSWWDLIIKIHYRSYTVYSLERQVKMWGVKIMKNLGELNFESLFHQMWSQCCIIFKSSFFFSNIFWGITSKRKMKKHLWSIKSKVINVSICQII